jgi:DNA-binding MarR family transcriptional regulator
MPIKKDLSSDIIKTFFSIRSLMQRFLLKKGKISFMRIMVLCYLLENKSPTMKEMADYFGITMPSASSIIDNLVEMNMIERKDDSKDRRLIRIQLTKNGGKTAKRELGATIKNLGLIISTLSRDEKRRFFEIMKKIHKNLLYENLLNKKVAGKTKKHKTKK